MSSFPRSVLQVFLCCKTIQHAAHRHTERCSFAMVHLPSGSYSGGVPVMYMCTVLVLIVGLRQIDVSYTYASNVYRNKILSRTISFGVVSKVLRCQGEEGRSLTLRAVLVSNWKRLYLFVYDAEYVHCTYIVIACTEIKSFHCEYV